MTASASPALGVTAQPASQNSSESHRESIGDTLAALKREGINVRVVQHATPRQHVIVWLIGVLLASLIPFLFLLLHGLDNGGPPSLFELLEHGDLLLISLVVTIAGITELALAFHMIQSNQFWSAVLLLLGAVLVIVAEALWYADLSAQILDGQKMDSSHIVTYGSLLLFALSALGSSMSVRIAAGTR